MQSIHFRQSGNIVTRGDIAPDQPCMGPRISWTEPGSVPVQRVRAFDIVRARGDLAKHPQRTSFQRRDPQQVAGSGRCRDIVARSELTVRQRE